LPLISTISSPYIVRLSSFAEMSAFHLRLKPFSVGKYLFGSPLPIGVSRKKLFEILLHLRMSLQAVGICGVEIESIFGIKVEKGIGAVSAPAIEPVRAKFRIVNHCIHKMKIENLECHGIV
jgi:hypothetical protein